MEHEKLHKGGKQFICPVCNRGYKKIQVLKDHPTNHNETVTSKGLEDNNWWGTIHLYGMWRTIRSWISRDGTRKTAQGRKTIYMSSLQPRIQENTSFEGSSDESQRDRDVKRTRGLQLVRNDSFVRYVTPNS